MRSRNLTSITMDDLVKEAAEHGRGKGSIWSCKRRILIVFLLRISE